MEDKVPVRVLNVQNKSFRLLKGTHLGKLTEATTEIKQVGNGKEKDAKILGGHYSVNSYTDISSDLVDLFGKSSKGMTSMQYQSLTELLCRYEDVFSREEYDLSTFTAIKHQIDTENAKPIWQPARRTPITFQSEEVEYLQKQLDAGVVVPSSSAWPSPVVLVRKKDGGVRWCVDYRRVNEITQKNAYPLPKIGECLDTLSGSKLFSTLDLLSGYHQFEVYKRDKPKSAFITRHGLFEYTRMPFGLCNFRGTWNLY